MAFQVFRIVKPYRLAFSEYTFGGRSGSGQSGYGQYSTLP